MSDQQDTRTCLSSVFEFSFPHFSSLLKDSYELFQLSYAYFARQRSSPMPFSEILFRRLARGRPELISFSVPHV